MRSMYMGSLHYGQAYKVFVHLRFMDFCLSTSKKRILLQLFTSYVEQFHSEEVPSIKMALFQQPEVKPSSYVH